MREDMFKVIVQRPRSGRSWASKSKLRYVKGEGPRRMTGKRIVIENDCRTKHLNENLAPLKRYLHKQRGRKWNDVFSEICARLDTGSTVKMHVRDHIGDFIERNIRRDAQGQYWASGRWDTPQPVSQWSELYVDPQDGIIKETRLLCRKLGLPTQREYWRKQRLSYDQHGGKIKTLRKITDTLYLVQKDGIWYIFELASLPLTPSGYGYCDKELYDFLCQSSWHDDTLRRVTSKQQLFKKQLRNYGLSNTGGHYG